jgi:hypothetical protein
MASRWPATLPQKLNSDGFVYSKQDNIIRSGVDIGKPKQRPRYTAVFEEFEGSMIITKDQINTFLYFWDTTLSSGVLPFEWEHPLTDETKDMEFLSMYEITPESGTLFKLKISFRVLP